MNLPVLQFGNCIFAASTIEVAVIIKLKMDIRRENPLLSYSLASQHFPAPV